MNDTENIQPRHPNRARQIFESLVVSDYRLILSYIALLSVPSLLFALELFEGAPALYPFVVLIDRGLALMVLYSIWRRWFPRFQRNDQSVFDLSLQRLLGWGFAYWLPLLPPILLLNSQDPLLTLVGMSLLFPVLLILYRFFFYILPLAAGVREPRAVLMAASSVLQQSTFLPMRTLSFPAGAYVLLLAIAFSFSPDGREPIVPVLLAVAEGVTPVLLSYVAFAQVMAHASDELREKFSLLSLKEIDQKHTLSKGFPFESLSLGKAGLLLILIGASLSVMNDRRAATLPPAVDIALLDTKAEGNKTSLLLEFSDKRYNFRGFSPLSLRLGWGSGKEIAILPQLEEVKNEGHQSDRIKQYWVHFTLEESERRRLASEEVFLWYREVKLFPVELPQDATAVDSASQEAETQVRG